MATECHRVPLIATDRHWSPLIAGAVLLPLGSALPGAEYIPVTLDSQLLGRVHLDVAPAVESAMRCLKLTVEDRAAAAAAAISSAEAAISSLEIALVMPGADGRFAGLYLFCGAARFLRPVLNLKSQRLEQARNNRLAIPWQSHGDPMAIPWRSHGDPMAIRWRSDGNHTAITCASMNLKARGSCDLGSSVRMAVLAWQTRSVRQL